MKGVKEPSLPAGVEVEVNLFDEHDRRLKGLSKPTLPHDTTREIADEQQHAPLSIAELGKGESTPALFNDELSGCAAEAVLLELTVYKERDDQAIPRGVLEPPRPDLDEADQAPELRGALCNLLHEPALIMPHDPAILARDEDGAPHSMSSWTRNYKKMKDKIPETELNIWACSEGSEPLHPEVRGEPLALLGRARQGAVVAHGRVQLYPDVQVAVPGEGDILGPGAGEADVSDPV